MIGILAIALILLQCNLVSASGKCYSQMLCTNGNSSEAALDFTQIHPPPECRKLEGKTDRDALKNVFDHMIKRFRHDLKNTVAEQCSSCNVTKPLSDIEKPVQQQECFVPVVCNGDEGLRTSWMQIRPYPSCQRGKDDRKLEEYTSRLLNYSRNEAVKELEMLLFDQCAFCRSAEMRNVIEQLKKEDLRLFKDEVTSDHMDCYAPAVCQNEGEADLEWRKMSSTDKCSRMPEHVFDSALQRVIRGLKEILKTECPKTCKPDATCYMGIKSGKISNSAMTASSQWDEKYAAYFGRLDNLPSSDNGGVWHAAPDRNVSGEWIQVDFRSPSVIAGVITQGRPTFNNQWVMSYKISCGNTNDTMTVVTENGTEKIFSGNHDIDSKVYNRFPQPLTCRYIRIYPQSWNEYITMRIEYVKGGCYDSFTL